MSLEKRIMKAKPKDLQKLLDAVMKRYEQVYPEWEVSVISVRRCEDRVEQLDRTIQLLEGMKTRV